MDMVEVIKIEQEDDDTAMGVREEGAGAKDLCSHEEEPSGKVKKKKRRRKQCVSDPPWKRACVDCTKRCTRVHGRAASSSSSDKAPPATPPSFFKVMMGHFSENMDIPPPFAKTIADLAGANVFLEDAFGLRWRVRLCCSRDSGRLSFGHGWKNFVLDHAVAVGEFLVLRHIARSVFAVQIFAKSACERLYLCEKNKRQSRKRKPKEKTTSVSNRTVKVSKKSNGAKDKRSNKKQRTSEVLDGDQDIIMDDQVYVMDANTEAENSGGSNLASNAELATPLAMMGLDDEITDDIFLSADAYEFETDFCNPDAFCADLNMQGVEDNGQASGFSCAEEMSLRNSESPVGVCLENKQTTDVLVASRDDGYVAVQDMDMNTLPSNELSELREGSSSPEIDAQLPSSVCAIETRKKDKEGFVPEDSSAEHDDLQMQDGAGQVAAEINSGNPQSPELRKYRRRNSSHMQTEAKYREGLKSGNLKPGNRKFCITVPPQDQTWLELPCRLPVLPRRKKQGRKVLVLEDPCTRHWPVLYLCTPSFSGLVAGWADVSAENGLREGDACELELHGTNSNLALRVRLAGSQ